MPADTSGIDIHWYRTPIERETLRALTRRSDGKGLLQVLPHLALVTFSGAAAFYALAWLPFWTLFPILFVHGSLYAFSPTASTSLPMEPSSRRSS